MAGPFALISDIHSNLEALTRVLADIDLRGIRRIFCLGDVIGYGPDPEAVSDLVRERCERVIRGNHDEALFSGPHRFNPMAREALLFTRRRLEPRLFRRGNAERWEWLRDLPLTFRLGDLLFVHGSPVNPVEEYVYREDVYFSAETKLKPIFELIDLAAFGGHTHLPGVIRSDLETWVPTDEANTYTLEPACKHLVNVGSVGQPRDGDPRACWVELTGDSVRYHRVAYDHEATAAKIRKFPELHDLLAARLGRGM